jgi:hypothetical protein
MDSLSDVVDPVIWQRITTNIIELLGRRKAMQARIDDLTAAGCINGNIVEEYRNATTEKPVSGPYFRLTFYKDPETGQKPAPKYLGKDMGRVNAVQEQIDNYQQRESYRKEIEEINRVLISASARIEGLDHFLRFETGQMKQLELVMPNPGGPGPDITKQE